jgi:hypothetical protein
LRKAKEWPYRPLHDRRADLEKLAEALLAWEDLDRDDVAMLLVRGAWRGLLRSNLETAARHRANLRRTRMILPHLVSARTAGSVRADTTRIRGISAPKVQPAALTD